MDDVFSFIKAITLFFLVCKIHIEVSWGLLEEAKEASHHECPTTTQIISLSELLRIETGNMNRVDFDVFHTTLGLYRALKETLVLGLEYRLRTNQVAQFRWLNKVLCICKKVLQLWHWLLTRITHSRFCCVFVDIFIKASRFLPVYCASQRDYTPACIITRERSCKSWVSVNCSNSITGSWICQAQLSVSMARLRQTVLRLWKGTAKGTKNL